MLVRRRRRIIAAAVVLVALLAILGYRVFARFTDYDILTERERTDSARTQYVPLFGNLLAYSLDGVSYTDKDGTLIWNESYEMLHPVLRTCPTGALIFDRQGTQVKRITEVGVSDTIHTTLPVIEADIAENGVVAILMQEGEIGHIEIYNSDGQLAAGGELYMTGDGYPIDIAVSSDGKHLCASLLDLGEGDVNAKLIFYDFGSSGEKMNNYVTGTQTYVNSVIPEIDYVRGDRLLAVSDTGIMVFTNADAPKADKEVFFNGQVRSVMHNDKYFAYIASVTNNDGMLENKLFIYSMSGLALAEKVIEEDYTSCDIAYNNEIVLSDGQSVSVYSIFGIRRFFYTFAEGVSEFFPCDRFFGYLVIKQNTIERIRVK